MSSCEFFDRLRRLALAVDKESNELKGLLENSEISTYDENRTCLLLRETLAQVKDCESEVSTKLEEVQHRHLFGDFISACERLTQQTKQQINDLENHLVKYGYTKPKEELPDLPAPPQTTGDLPLDQQDVAMESSTTYLISDQSEICHREVIQSESSSDTQEDIPVETNQTELSAMKENFQDMLKSPVPPTTFTKLIEVTPERPLSIQQRVLQEKGQTTPCLTPEVPQTTTPMLKCRQAEETIHTPTRDSSQEPHLPSQPVTVTPIIKANERAHSAVNLPVSPVTPPLPAPPMIGTPGLKPLAPYAIDSPLKPLSLDSLPSPPDITSVQILKPDDIILPSVPQEDLNTKHLFVRPLNEQDYEKLPLYVANHFSLNHINHLLEVLNNFLSSNTEAQVEQSMLEQDLRSLLDLGAATKAFLLALAKTGRLKVVEKNIVFLSTA